MEQEILPLSAESFADATASGVVLVDFYADWCAPCRALAPILQRVAADLGADVRVVKLNIETGQQIAADHQITSIPTLLLLAEGKEIERMVGLHQADVIVQRVHAALNIR